MDLFLTDPELFAEAIRKLNVKLPAPSPNDTSEWQEMPTAIRESSFFSARVESARALARIQEFILDFLTSERDTNEQGESYLKIGGRAQFIKEASEILEQLGVDTTRSPDEKGTLLDIMSESRLGLIFDIQTQMAQGYGWWAQGNDPDVLDSFPCQELVRVRQRRLHRDWMLRWKLAKGQFYNGRMIARKDDEIWFAISRFGVPWPPYDFNSGMGVRDIERSEAEDLGIITAKDQIKPPQKKFRSNLEASVKNLPANILERLKEALGEDYSGLLEQ